MLFPLGVKSRGRSRASQEIPVFGAKHSFKFFLEAFDVVMTRASSDETPFVLSCAGPLALVRSDGQDCTPRNAKTCGVLAILARSSNAKRGRRWIEAKLWSDRGRTQASGSMRQALAELRRCLGPHSEGLIADRWNIALDPKIVRITFDAPPHELGRDLFEGLEVRDPAFAKWLSQERLGLSKHDISTAASTHAPLPQETKRTASDPISIQLSISNDPLSQSIVQQVSQNLDEMSQLRLLREIPGKPLPAEMTLFSSVQSDEASKVISLQLCSQTGEIVWTGSRMLGNDLENDLFGFSNDVTEAVLRATRHLPKMDPAESLRERALDELFSFDAKRLRVADSLLEAAHEMRPDPLVLAWRAFARMIMIIERTEVDTDTLRLEAEQMIRHALENRSSNPTLMALASQINMFLGVDLDGLELLARQAAERNSGSAMARMSVGTLALRSGDTDGARRMAQSALKSSGKGRLSHWTHMFCCLTEMSAGNFRLATLHAESALALAPSFRPPLRHLYALDLEAGRTSRARRLLAQLRQEDPDFSMRMIRETPEYPASTLRGSGLAIYRDVESEDM